MNLQDVQLYTARGLILDTIKIQLSTVMAKVVIVRKLLCTFAWRNMVFERSGQVWKELGDAYLRLRPRLGAIPTS